MATFIQGLTDYIPKVEPYRPDFDFLNKALATKQAKYDSAIDQLSGMYGNIINADLTRNENIQSRDNFLQNAQKNIQQITAMDLSDPKNVQLAQKVFEPFVQDKKLQYDIMFTKADKRAISEAEYLRSASDPELNKQYWNEGVREVNYRLQEFKAASGDKAYRMALPKYTPNINIMAEAKKLIGDDFLDISIDEKVGGYIVTTKNGPHAVKTVQQFLNGALSTDPRVRNYANTLAYVQSMDNITGIANQKYNGDLNAAKADYYLNNTSNIISGAVDQIDDFRDELNSVESKLAMYDSRLSRNQKLSPNEQAEYQRLQTNKKLYDSNISAMEDNLTTLNNAVSSRDIDLLEKSSQGILARNIINSQLNDAIQTVAYSKMQRKMDADPFELAKFESNLEYSNWTRKKSLEWAREDELKRREKEELDNKYQFSSTRVIGEAGTIDSYINDTETLTTSQNDFSNSVRTTVSSLNAMGAQDPNIKRALDKALASKGYNYNQVLNGNIGTIGFAKVTDAINDMISKDPEIAKAMGPLINNMNSKKQVNFANAATIQKNNVVTFQNMLRDTDLDNEEKYVLGKMFTKDGSLVSSQAAYNSDPAIKRAFSYGAFKERYDDVYKKYADNYNEQAKNNNPLYKPVGMLGIGGGGTITEYAVSGIADPKNPKTKTYKAFVEIVGEGFEPGTLVKAGKVSGDDISKIQSDPELQAYVVDIVNQMKVNNAPINYSYKLMGLGSTKYNTLNIKLKANDPLLASYKKDNPEIYKKILTEGISIIMPSKNKNNYIARTAALSDAEIVLNASGKYEYVNPRVGNITFKKEQDNTYSMSGFIDNKPVNQMGLDIIKINSVINSLNSY